MRKALLNCGPECHDGISCLTLWCFHELAPVKVSVIDYTADFRFLNTRLRERNGVHNGEETMRICYKEFPFEIPMHFLPIFQIAY